MCTEAWGGAGSVRIAERGSGWLGHGVCGDRGQEEAAEEGRSPGEESELELLDNGSP